jgi:hypothetical protein
MLAWILFALAALIAVAACFVAYRFYKKAVVYDTIFLHINDDVIAALRQFAKMSTSPILGNDAEIQEAHRLIMIMGKRFNEISLRMEDASGLKLRPPPPLPRPKVA